MEFSHTIVLSINHWGKSSGP